MHTQTNKRLLSSILRLLRPIISSNCSSVRYVRYITIPPAYAYCRMNLVRFTGHSGYCRESNQSREGLQKLLQNTQRHVTSGVTGQDFRWVQWLDEGLKAESLNIMRSKEAQSI
jgi:hypothetical protein